MDRKALIRAYKDTPRPMGIYRVQHVATGRSLVGRSKDLPAILNRERAQLRLGVHRNAALQRDWNAFGAEAFAFEVLDTLAPPDRDDYDPTDDLAVLEAMWLERLGPLEDGGYMRPRKAAQ
jgi:hypothetical protein